MCAYLILAIISVQSLTVYLKENSFVDYEVVLSSDLAPRITILAPAYNEARTIVENVRSLLTLQYNHYEVVVINDGGNDHSIELLCQAYQLEEVKFNIDKVFQTEKIVAAYRSTNTAFKKLLVIDKKNGGKADALNVGIMFASHPYILCVDVDCILSKDALLVLAKPFLEKSETRIIATGGVVRVANSCEIKGGSLVEIKPPKKLLPRTQIIEYLRAFLLGRMAWYKLDGLLIISGAFGMFDKEIAIKAGGYNRKTVGEDMELVVRMRRYMIEHKQKYQVTYLPNPLCWTEVPETFKTLGNQRRRWTRGTMETLWTHRKMFFNPRYKLLGMLSIPYWVFLEYLTPLIELLGILLTIIFIMLGIISIKYIGFFILFAYGYAVLFSILALLTEEYTFHQYKKFSHFRKLLVAAFIEPVYTHFYLLYAAFMGNIEEIQGVKVWGEMKREGFANVKKANYSNVK
ncbi:MAG: glycosyltransferase [Chitinophagaceae bacterium]|nr:MAG: glycosyltransferase [Chitinophagaceae bacterium]